MRIFLFYHSVISDWNHGNAHFLRGIISSLSFMGHEVHVLEPKGGWSLKNLLSQKGKYILDDFRHYFPFHNPVMYREKDFDPENYLQNADLVIVHEWNDPDLVRRIGEFRSFNRNMILLFHDTHHRSVTAPHEMGKFNLRNYDGVLAFGEVIRKIYIQNGWAGRVWTWHEAADDRIFHPVIPEEKEGDLVWVGNWGDEERTDELQEFIIEPVLELGLKACFYGVRYPARAVRMLKKAGIKYRGWIPNYKVPEVFGRFRVTVHVPRRPYVKSLPGIPTIRPFEALACGIPLVSSPWEDVEGLFTIGKDFLMADNGEEMKTHLHKILTDTRFARSLASHGLETIRNKHTCDHRAGQLIDIIREIKQMKHEQILNGSVHA